MKENKILKLIYVAWRERWTDSQFGINIKTVLPRGVSGDVYDLADCLLQQAMVGTTANNLVLSHLQHSLCSHLVSYAAVVQSIAKYEQIDRIYCVISLLDFLDSILDGVTCRTKPEEAVLPGAISSLVHWLMRIIASVAKELDTQTNLSAEHSHMLDRACACAETIAKCEFLLGVLYVGYHEDNDQHTKILEQYALIKGALAKGVFQLPTPSCEKNLNKLAFLDLNDLKLPELDGAMIPQGVESISYCVQPLLAVEVLLNPCNDTAYYVTAMQMVQRLRKFSNARLFYEIIRAGFMSMSNVNETSGDTMWGAFTFFKVPQIIKQLNASSLPPSLQGTSQEFIPQVVEAFEMLLEDNLLLDFLYTKCSTNIIEDLLNDWTKQQLISEEHVKKFTQQRDNASLLAQKRDSANQSIINFIMRAEVPLSGILKTLSADYNKVQEALVGVLCQVLVGNSFDLILSVATVEGRLRTFVSRLIQCNENSKQVSTEIGKPSVIRSTLFDVSFLMLTFIVQTYGSEVVLAENGDSFFEKWVRECMVERNKPKNPKNILALCDETIVDELLLSLSKPDTQLKSTITWQDICMNLPGVLHHVLIAWEKESISSADVKNILENIKKRLFTYSICATSFICSYMFCVKENELLKPLNMIQQFLTPPVGDEMSTQENVKERLGLSFQIIRKMQHDVHPSGNPKARSITLTQGLVSQTPLIEQFKEVWKSVQEHGWLPVRAAQTLESLLQAGGPGWLATQLIEEILRCKYTRDMCKTMDLVFAVLHLNIEQTTAALLQEVLPIMIYKRQGNDINEPQTLILARLAVHCIISCLETRQPITTPKKRTRSSDSDELDGSNSAKMRKMNVDGSTPEATATAVANEIINETSLLLGGNGGGSSAGNGGGAGGNGNDNANAATPGGNGGNGNGNGGSIEGGNSNGGNNPASNENTAASATTPATDPITDLAVIGSNSNNGNGNLNGSGGNQSSTNQQRDSTNAQLSEPLQSSIQYLFRVLESFIRSDDLSPKVIFAFQFITLLVEYGQDRVSPVLRLLPANLIQTLLKILLTVDISVGLIARLYDVRTLTGRQQAISDLTLLRNIELRRFASTQM